jgi:hypothetical protein
MDNELEYMGTEMVIAVFRVLLQYLPGEAERNHEICESGELVFRLEF